MSDILDSVTGPSVGIEAVAEVSEETMKLLKNSADKLYKSLFDGESGRLNESALQKYTVDQIGRISDYFQTAEMYGAVLGISEYLSRIS